ncbi:E3 ubiquitin-protein ligase TRIM39-like isoform X2 [Microcaecilia unicolor]|uniref:E3 ubiquitin-protein ligase TRIM39-like isoform X2 n=1 Tax=Microcaecilia unicolor TaxID=1415580 RepID=A0A6P7Y4C0_9AMPH|nr:E3 ubiquitin-protein ligase TRIM39-like isoform X2 [Microcaecilia unicolor]
MAAANPAESLREEISCPICLDHFTDPVILDCGHNFCRSCINRSWEWSDTNFPCPQCRKRSRKRNLRPNRQLANMTETVKNLSRCSFRPKEENLCEKHEEKLKLFCREDQKAICVVCDRSQGHRSHTVIPIEEAVQEYKEKIKMHLEPLRKDLEDLLMFRSHEEKKAEVLRRETEIKRQKVESEFEELHQFLNKQKQILLSRLEEEEKKILQRIRENVTQLEEQSSSFTHLISEIEEKSQQPAAKLLKGVKDALSRCQKMKFPEPQAVSSDLKMDFELGYPQQLNKLVTKFGDWWMEYGRYAVDVTLNTETAHPEVVLFEDRKSVRWEDRKQILPDNTERFDTDPCVLGCEGFSSGRHYWEVEVGDETDWALGVCKDSVRRKGRILLSPGEGYWTVALWYGEYSALTSPKSPISLKESLQAVGILLDYEAGKVSFYNADKKSHLFTFTDTFTGTLRPFFYLYLYQSTLKVRPMAAWE